MKESDKAIDELLQAAMREWLLECFTNEHDQEKINDLKYHQLIQMINVYYDGGMKNFISVYLEDAKIQFKEGLT